MSTPTKYIAVTNYTEIFGTPLPADGLTFVRSYPTELLLVKLSQLNAILFQQTEHSEQTLRSLQTLFPGRDVSLILKLGILNRASISLPPL
ncbi:hypothetical protein [Dyadobacter alkalitolerans]|uniref:hypothetical protein n=1 Tax=Dyadobacter alkalitolerans TaxID=492736 RepID=UPI0012F92163|nr:hypothetical protein [Dyadobacter alkalitolerans]